MPESAVTSFLQSPLPMLLMMFVIFYFFLIRPQQQKQKDHSTMVSALEKNDEIITASGVHATIVEVREKTAILRIADNVRIEIEKDSIAQVAKKK